MGGAARLIYTLYRNDVVIQNSKIRILSIRCEVTSKVTKSLVISCNKITCTLISLFICNMYCIMFNCALNPALFFGYFIWLRVGLYNNYVNQNDLLTDTNHYNQN